MIFNTKPTLTNQRKETYPNYVRKWQKAMNEAYELAAKQSHGSQIQNKSNYDKSARSTALQEGDRVLVRNLSERGGPGKLRSYWEKEIHRVIKRDNENSPVYQVVSERDPSSKIRTLHRNLLLPCDELPFDKSEAPNFANRPKRNCVLTRRNSATDSAKKMNTVDENSKNEESDSEDEIVLIIPLEQQQKWIPPRPPTPYHQNRNKEERNINENIEPNDENEKKDH